MASANGEMFDHAFSGMLNDVFILVGLLWEPSKGWSVRYDGPVYISSPSQLDTLYWLAHLNDEIPAVSFDLVADGIAHRV